MFLDRQLTGHAQRCWQHLLRHGRLACTCRASRFNRTFACFNFDGLRTFLDAFSRGCAQLFGSAVNSAGFLFRTFCRRFLFALSQRFFEVLDLFFKRSFVLRRLFAKLNSFIDVHVRS